MAKSGFCNGSDILVYVGGKAVGSCTSHTLTLSSEVKTRSVKPLASKKTTTSGLWQKKTVVGLSISISVSALVFYDETECGFKTLFKMWKEGKEIECKCMERDTTEKPYVVGKFIITNLEENAPAGDDTTYTLDLENSDEPTTLDETAITENTVPVA